jgi:hypothetical protein
MYVGAKDTIDDAVLKAIGGQHIGDISYDTPGSTDGSMDMVYMVEASTFAKALSNDQRAVGLERVATFSEPSTCSEVVRPPIGQRVAERVGIFLRSRLPGEKTKKGMAQYDRLTSHLPESLEKRIHIIRPVVKGAMYATNTWGTIVEAVVTAAVVGGSVYLLKERITNPAHFRAIVKNLGMIPRSALSAIGNEIDNVWHSPREWLRQALSARPTDQWKRDMQEKNQRFLVNHKEMHQRVLNFLNLVPNGEMTELTLAKYLAETQSWPLSDSGTIDALFGGLKHILYRPFDWISSTLFLNTDVSRDTLIYAAIDWHFHNNDSPQSKALKQGFQELTKRISSTLREEDIPEFNQSVASILGMGKNITSLGIDLLNLALKKAYEFKQAGLSIPLEDTFHFSETASHLQKLHDGTYDMYMTVNDTDLLERMKPRFV